MEIERIEDWIGREVVDTDGNKIGKLDEVYYDGDAAVVGEVKHGLLSRKRELVPLRGAVVTRDSVRVEGTYDGDVEAYESASARTQRLADVAEAQQAAQAADAEAARRQVDAEDAAEKAQAAKRAAEEATEAHKIAEARVERVQNRKPAA
jgi:hypothetical protein